MTDAGKNEFLDSNFLPLDDRPTEVIDALEENQ
jgi:hypothetical protein